MIKVTPTGQWHKYTGQDHDEKNQLLADLQANTGEYLAHSDAMVRAYADWALEYYGIRNLRNIPRDRVFPANVHNPANCLHRLYRRLREIA